MFMGYNIFSFVSTLGESSGKKKSDNFPVFKRPATTTTTTTTNAASSSSSTTSASVVKEEGDGGDEMRGYKKTKDGRTTSYFTRELSEKDAAILASSNKGPRRIDSSGNSLDDDSSPTPITMPFPSTGGSQWNSAGTFEEKDISVASSKYLQEELLKLSLFNVAQSGMNVKVQGVKSMAGEVSSVFSRGKYKFIYDLSFEVNFVMTSLDCKHMTSGSLNVTDVIADEVAEVQICNVVGSHTDRRQGGVFRSVIGSDASVQSNDGTLIWHIGLVLQHFLVHLKEQYAVKRSTR